MYYKNRYNKLKMVVIGGVNVTNVMRNKNKIIQEKMINNTKNRKEKIILKK